MFIRISYWISSNYFAVYSKNTEAVIIVHCVAYLLSPVFIILVLYLIPLRALTHMQHLL